MNNFIRITELNKWDVTSAFSSRFSKFILTPSVLKPIASAAKLIPCKELPALVVWLRRYFVVRYLPKFFKRN